MGAARGKRGTVTVAERCVERCMAGVRQWVCDDNGSGQPQTRSAGCCKGVGGGAACDRVPARQKKAGSNGRRGTHCGGLVGIRRAKKGEQYVPAVGHSYPRAVQSPWAWTQGSQAVYPRAQPMPGGGPQWGLAGSYQLQAQKKVTIMFIST